MTKKVNKSKMKRVIKSPVAPGKIPVKLIREAIKRANKSKAKRK